MSALENELREFIDYVDRWFPSVRAIKVFGSYLWKTDPNDVDVIAEFEERSYQPPREAFSRFPHIDYCMKLALGETGVPVKPFTKTVWTRALGVIDIHPRVTLEEAYTQEVTDLRRQIMQLREKMDRRRGASGDLSSFGSSGASFGDGGGSLGGDDGSSL